MELTYLRLADAVLILHTSIAIFVVVGLLLILVGNWWRWGWVNGFWFRLAHLGAIATVVAEAWLGLVCPLTTLEMWLREQANQTIYQGSFIEHWLQTLLYYDAPAWVFTLAYTLFGLVVLATWLIYPPRRKR